MPRNHILLNSPPIYELSFIFPHALQVHHLCSMKEPHSVQFHPKLASCRGAGAGAETAVVSFGLAPRFPIPIICGRSHPQASQAKNWRGLMQVQTSHVQ
jgi:hypothetical protein